MFSQILVLYYGRLPSRISTLMWFDGWIPHFVRIDVKISRFSMRTLVSFIIIYLPLSLFYSISLFTSLSLSIFMSHLYLTLCLSRYLCLSPTLSFYLRISLYIFALTLYCPLSWNLCMPILLFQISRAHRHSECVSSDSLTLVVI